MAKSARRTATYDASVLEAIDRVRHARTYRRAFVELAGREPTTDSSLLNDLARIALAVIERRALESGYRQLGSRGDDDPRPVEEFLAAEALAGFDYDDDEDPEPLLQFLARDDE